jgi:hypothetical protein
MPSVCQILAVTASYQAPISDPLALILHLLHVVGHAIIAHLTLKRWQRRQVGVPNLFFKKKERLSVA